MKKNENKKWSKPTLMKLKFRKTLSGQYPDISAEDFTYNNS